MKDEDEYIRYFSENETEIQIIKNLFSISYSEFFRNPLTFSVLEKIILPELVLKMKNSGKKELRLWSAACSSGQEVYSLTMLLEEIKNNENKKIRYRIFATDMNADLIERARTGNYNQQKMSLLTLKRVKDWFIFNGDSYSVKPELKTNIDFSVFNLLNEDFIFPPTSIYGDFDIVMCSNILFYFNPLHRKMIIDKIAGCLSANGFFITGETERDILLKNKFKETFPGSAIFSL